MDIKCEDKDNEGNNSDHVRRNDGTARRKRKSTNVENVGKTIERVVNGEMYYSGVRKID